MEAPKLTKRFAVTLVTLTSIVIAPQVKALPRQFLNVDMPMAKARQQLFANGWSPVSRTQEETEAFVNDPPFPETQSCIPTGLAACYSHYRKGGRKLVILHGYVQNPEITGWQVEGISPRGDNLVALTDWKYQNSFPMPPGKIKPGETEKRRKWLRIRECISDPNTMFWDCNPHRDGFDY